MRSSAVLLAVLALSLTTYAQQPAPVTSIQATSHLVSVDVVVRDGSGHIVRGLTADDFRVLEDGKEQSIDSFAEHAASSTAAVAANPQMLSNVAAGAGSSVNIILFDFFDTAPADYGYARKQMLHFLEALPPGHQTALFVLGSRLRMLQGFTGSTDRLLEAARRMQTETSMVETTGQHQQDDDTVARFKAAMGPNPSGHDPAEDQAQTTFGQDALRANGLFASAMQEIAEAVSGYPGRKNLYWLSDTFPAYGGPLLEINELSSNLIRGTMNTQDMAAFNQAESSAQIAIYPISLVGVEASGMGAEAGGMTSASQLFIQRNAQRDLLNNLADTTGGHATFGTNDISGALARGFEDGSDYYALAYMPANRKWDGRFRTIALKTPHAHYELSYRRGYYATDTPAAGSGDARAVMAMALAPEVPQATAIGLSAPVPASPAPSAPVEVHAHIAPTSVAFTTDARGRHEAKLLVTLVALPDPPDTDPSKDKLPLQTSGIYVVDLDDAAFRKLFTDGMPVAMKVPLPTGRYRLRLGVCDLANHNLGTLDLPVTVPAPPK